MLFADSCLGQHPGGEVAEPAAEQPAADGEAGEVVEPAVEQPAADGEAGLAVLVQVLEVRGVGAAVRADAHLEVGLGELVQVLWAGNLCVLDL